MIYIKIGGIIDISTKDIPQKSSMVIFTVGCNFRCEFCHNKYLLYPNVGKDIGLQNIISKITSNLLVGSVSISGGEPTLQNDIIEVCKQISATNKYLSVDTNGSRPEIIMQLLPYINRIALDLKVSPLNEKRYDEITNSKSDPLKIIESFSILNTKEGLDFEIRTTYVENLIEPEDIHEIISFLQENEFKGNFVLQQYQSSEGVEEKYRQKFEKPLHSTMLNILKPYKDLILPFDIYLRNEVVGYKKINEIFVNIK